VYALIHPETKAPFYIGKGFNNRAIQHIADTNKTTITSGVKAEEITEALDEQTKQGQLKALSMLRRFLLSTYMRRNSSRIFASERTPTPLENSTTGVTWRDLILNSMIRASSPRFRHALPINSIFTPCDAFQKLKR